jgi:NitT/TauT family transport system substrate-binding protein
MAKRWFPGALLVAVLLACGIAPAWAEHVSLMVGGIEKQIYLPLMLTERLGYFRDEGLEVDLLSEPAGVEAADEMLAGAVQGVVGFYDHNIDLQALGKYTESVVQFSRVPGEVELIASGHPEISSFADFKGKTIGVTGLGSSTDFLTEYLLLKAGLKLSDVTPLPVGAGDTLIASMKHGEIVAAMTTEPTVSRLLHAGAARILVDLRTVAGTRAALGGLYPAACLYMQTSWVETHKPTVQKLVNAFVRTLHYMATHDPQIVADQMPADYYVGEKSMYVDALSEGISMFTSDGRMPQGGPEDVLRVLSTIKPTVRDRPIDLGRTYTNSFVNAANASLSR